VTFKSQSITKQIELNISKRAFKRFLLVRTFKVSRCQDLTDGVWKSLKDAGRGSSSCSGAHGNLTQKLQILFFTNAIEEPPLTFGCSRVYSFGIVVNK
jgi:hypothetical protein